MKRNSIFSALFGKQLSQQQRLRAYRLHLEHLENRSLLTTLIDSTVSTTDIPGGLGGQSAMVMDATTSLISSRATTEEVTWGYGLTEPGKSSAWEITGMPLGEFQTRLNFVKRATIDPLLAPGNANFWHAHDFFVNPAIDENSTFESLMMAKDSDATPTSNLSAYWTPSLFNQTSGEYVTPLETSIAYYQVQKPLEPSKIRTMPAGLSMIAGNAMPTERQSAAVVFWNYIGTLTQYDHIPQGDEWQDRPLQAVILFPQFWNGESLTGQNFKDHMAYDRGGDGGPSSHPYLLPELQLQIHYGHIPRNAQLMLSSDVMTQDRPGYAPGWSMHADFIHTPWPEKDTHGNLYDGFERRVNDSLRWPTVADTDGNAARRNPMGLDQPFTPAPLLIDFELPGETSITEPPISPTPPPVNLPIATADGPDLHLAWPTPEIVMLTGVSVGIYGNVADPNGINELQLALRHESGAYAQPDGTFGTLAWHEGQIVAADGHWRLMFSPMAPGTYDLTVVATNSKGATSVAETSFRVIGETRVAPPSEPSIDNPTSLEDLRCMIPSDPPIINVTVRNRIHWESMRGIGFSVGSLGSLPNQTRLDNALKRVADLGFNTIRTWGSDAYTGRILEAIDRLQLPIQVQVGIYITTDSNAKGLIEQALTVIEPYQQHVLAVSLGNEQLADWNRSDLTVDQVLRQVTYFRERSNLPLTYNFSGETFRTWSSFWNQDGGRLLKTLDYINVHSYAGFFDNRFNPDWTPERQLAVLQADEAFFAEMLEQLEIADKPLVLGETGWQGSGYAPAVTNPTNMRTYYLDVTRYVYGPATRFDGMFYFNFTDESWKGGDDHWGLFKEGSSSSIGTSKFHLQKVSEILESTQVSFEVAAATTDTRLLTDSITGFTYVQDRESEPILIRRYDGYWAGEVPLSRGGATLVGAARDEFGRLRVLDVSEWGAFTWILDEYGLFVGEEGPTELSNASREQIFQIDLDGDGVIGSPTQ